jgi:hypothetical protein
MGILGSVCGVCHNGDDNDEELGQNTYVNDNHWPSSVVLLSLISSGWENAMIIPINLLLAISKAVKITRVMGRSILVAYSSP